MDHESPCEDSKDLTGLGSQMLCSLYRFKENEKFTEYQSGFYDVYVCHALAGAWGAVRPRTTGLDAKVTAANVGKFQPQKKRFWLLESRGE
ncbi:unnamed protein product [Dovyalis caffra]|uniref:Uncharacterized protein n=1 Tax=Dovyalis caffra TaxID=77055 RepID=A0AAV1QZX1_9ROSI|nr:unnamed protein product [Dovyalis caffra]